MQKNYANSKPTRAVVFIPLTEQQRITDAVKRLRRLSAKWNYSKLFLVSALFMIEYLETVQRREDDAAAERLAREPKYNGWTTSKKNRDMLEARLKHALEREQESIELNGGKNRSYMRKFWDELNAAKEAGPYKGDFPGGENVRE